MSLDRNNTIILHAINYEGIPEKLYILPVTMDNVIKDRLIQTVLYKFDDEGNETCLKVSSNHIYDSDLNKIDANTLKKGDEVFLVADISFIEEKEDFDGKENRYVICYGAGYSARLKELRVYDDGQTGKEKNFFVEFVTNTLKIPKGKKLDKQLKLKLIARIREKILNY